MNWIKTEFYLPEPNCLVLVARKDKDLQWKIALAFVFDRYDNLWWESNDKHYDLSRFTHWMHLPNYPLDPKPIRKNKYNV